MDEVKESLRAQMDAERSQYREEMITNQILDKLNSDLDFELPKEIVVRETQSRVDEIVTSNTERGIDEQELIQHQNEINPSGRTTGVNERQDELHPRADRREGGYRSHQGGTVGARRPDRRAQPDPGEKLTRQLEKSNGFGRIFNGLRISKTLQFLRSSAEVEVAETGALKED